MFYTSGFLCRTGLYVNSAEDKQLYSYLLLRRVVSRKRPKMRSGDSVIWGFMGFNTI